MSESRAHTKEEMLKKVRDHIEALPAYWAEVAKERGYSTEESLENLVFSFYTMLDGCCGGLPAFDLVPCPHPTDKEFHKEEGENWWEPVPINNTSLHETYSMSKRKKRS